MAKKIVQATPQTLVDIGGGGTQDKHKRRMLKKSVQNPPPSNYLLHFV